jgi:hypothetical protein
MSSLDWEHVSTQRLDPNMTGWRFYAVEGRRQCDPVTGCGQVKTLEEFTACATTCKDCRSDE